MAHLSRLPGLTPRKQTILKSHRKPSRRILPNVLLAIAAVAAGVALTAAITMLIQAGRP